MLSAASSHPVTRIARREHKLLITERQVDAVRARLSGICVWDPMAREDGRYRIDSLYFDTPGLALYHATVDEHLIRFKARARTYPDAPGAPVFLEVKHRQHDALVKRRAPVPRAGWAQLVDGRAPLGDRRLADPGVAHFVAVVGRHGLRPKALVRYEREAWVSTVDEYARVTFDRAIRCIPREVACLDAPDEARFRACDLPPSNAGDPRESLVVMELKFPSAVPRWMHGLVHALELERRAFSKYGAGIQMLRGRVLGLSDALGGRAPALRLSRLAGGRP